MNFLNFAKGQPTTPHSNLHELKIYELRQSGQPFSGHKKKANIINLPTTNLTQLTHAHVATHTHDTPHTHMTFILKSLNHISLESPTKILLYGFLQRCSQSARQHALGRPKNRRQTKICDVRECSHLQHVHKSQNVCYFFKSFNRVLKGEIL